MCIQNGLDDIQTQTHAVPVFTAGVVGLVETVEDQGQFLPGDGFAGVADGNIGLGALDGDGKSQRAALGENLMALSSRL